MFLSKNTSNLDVMHSSYLPFGLNIFISFYNYTSIQTYMMIIQAMGLERKLKAYKVHLPFDTCYAFSCPLCNLNTLGNIIMILHRYVEQVMAMCGVQDLQLSLSYFLSYYPLIVSDAISCPLHNLNTLRHIIVILYSCVEQVMTMCRKQE